MLMLHQLDRWRAIAGRAYGSGAELQRPSGEEGPARIVWNVAGNCESPVYREILGAGPVAETKPRYLPNQNVREARFLKLRSRAADPLRVDSQPSKLWKRGPIHVIELNVRCRKCSACLRAKAFHWRKRAEAEMSASAGRTWFGTLTLSPQEHFRMEGQARLRLASRGVSWDALPFDEKFGERCNETGQEVTRYLKRLRKEAGVKLRYCLVAEQHKSGLPHYHILIHEVSISGPVRHSSLKRQWKLGFADFKLVAQEQAKLAASYVAKYLTKSSAARVRASRGYGHATNTVYDDRAPKGLVERLGTQGVLEGVPQRGRNAPVPPLNQRTDTYATGISDRSEGPGIAGLAKAVTAETGKRQHAGDRPPGAACAPQASQRQRPTAVASRRKAHAWLGSRAEAARDPPGDR